MSSGTKRLPLAGTILRMTLADLRAEQNRLALARFEKALPDPFPAPALRTLWRGAGPRRRPGLPSTAYWRAHPLRADRLARALAVKSGAPAGWTWRLRSAGEPDLPVSFRAPPAPYREEAFSRGPGHCVVCGQPVYRLGWHVDLWDKGPNKNAVWHTACVTAWQLWNAPSDHANCCANCNAGVARPAARGCGGPRRSTTARPLFRVWREHRDTDWPTLLGYWGLPNLQVINRDVHAENRPPKRPRPAGSSQPPSPGDDRRDHIGGTRSRKPVTGLDASVLDHHEIGALDGGIDKVAGTEGPAEADGSP